tara:strand:- start:20 stop:577 length:558 start_codon:yes stop_codon:yes gene_type:complete
VIVLGLDVSTACTGWCILNSDRQIVDIGYIDTAKEKCLFKKASLVKSKIQEISIFHDIERVFIEENLQSFRSGFSSAQTLSKLSKYNGIVSYICNEELSISPEFVNVNKARGAIGIKLKRKKDGGADTKVQLLEWARNNLDYAWPEKILKSGPRKGQKIIDPRAHDMIDSYIVSAAGLVISQSDE